MEEGLMDTRWLGLAEKAFNAYKEAAGGSTWDGHPIPDWDAVSEKTQENWIWTVKVVCATVGRADGPQEPEDGVGGAGQSAS